MTDSIQIEIEPWPVYPDDGGAPAWNVAVTTSKGLSALVWSPRLDRFTRTWAAMNLRRGSPKAHLVAEAFMREFCSEMQHNKRDTSYAETGHKQAKSGQSNGTHAGTPSRAQENPGGFMSRLSRGTQTPGQGQSTGTKTSVRQAPPVGGAAATTGATSS